MIRSRPPGQIRHLLWKPPMWNHSTREDLTGAPQPCYTSRVLKNDEQSLRGAKRRGNLASAEIATARSRGPRDDFFSNLLGGRRSAMPRSLPVSPFAMILSLALAAVLAACGGGSDGTPSAAPPAPRGAAPRASAAAGD